jgi:uncharacterized membrane protein
MSTLSAILQSFALPWLDILALAWFTMWWSGYVWYADRRHSPGPTLRGQMNKFVHVWMERMVDRENRMLDMNVIRNLTRSSQFFASTTMLILGALVALMGYAEKAAGVMAELPFAQQVPGRIWELKIILLVLIFVYAFFKLSWSIRQFGICSILLAATEKDREDAKNIAAHIDSVALIICFANANFNNGLRAYYFGAAALAWFLHPVLMMILTVGVVNVLYRREFRSRTLMAMTY